MPANLQDHGLVRYEFDFFGNYYLHITPHPAPDRNVQPFTYQGESKEEAILKFLKSDFGEKCLFHEDLYRAEFEIDHLTKEQVVNKTMQRVNEIVARLQDGRYLKKTGIKRIEKIIARMNVELSKGRENRPKVSITLEEVTDRPITQVPEIQTEIHPVRTSTPIQSKEPQDPYPLDLTSSSNEGDEYIDSYDYSLDCAINWSAEG